MYKLFFRYFILIIVPFQSPAALATQASQNGATFAYIPDSLSVAVYDMATMTRVATIPTGGICATCKPSSSVGGIAVKLDGTRVYTANYDTDSVSVIDTLSNVVLATIPVGDFPNGIAVNSAGTRVYVANSSSNTVSVIDTGNNTVIATVPVGSFPEDVVVNASGSRVYVVNSKSNNVSVIDTSTNSVVTTITFGNVDIWSGNRITISPNDQRVYVTNYIAKSVSIIDTSCNCVIKTLPLSSIPSDIAINPAGTQVYVINGGGISIYDVLTNNFVANVSVSGYPHPIVFNANGSKAYVTSNPNILNSIYDTLSVIDTASNSVITVVALDMFHASSANARFFVQQMPSPSPQVIHFNPLLNQSLGTASYMISAQASSGLQVKFTSITPTTCIVNGNTVSLVATGTCTIKASQAGNVVYAPAPNIQQSFKISNVTASQTATFAYLGDYYSNRVYVFDMAGGGLVKTLTTGYRSIGFAASPDGKHVYVTNASEKPGVSTVSVIDTATQMVVAPLQPGIYPQGIAVNATGTRAYIANSNSSDVTVLDLVNNKTLTTVPIESGSGYPVGVAVNASGTIVYVTSYYSGKVSVIDAGSNTITATIPVESYPFGVAVNPDGTRVYVANRTPAYVSVIDTTSNTVVATINIMGGYLDSIAVDPTGTRAYVTNRHSGAVHVIDTATNTIITNVPMGGRTYGNAYGIALNSDGTRAYASTGNRVVAFDTASNSITSIATVPWGTDDAFGQFIAEVPCPCDQTISFGS